MTLIKSEFIGRLIHFRSVAASLLFFCGFYYFAQHVVSEETITIESKTYFLLFVTALTLYMSWLLGRRFVYLFVPTVMTIFTYGLLFFIDPPAQKIFFVVCASFAFYLGLLGIVRNRDNAQDVTAKSFLSIALVVSLFLFYSVAYGVYINYDVRLWVFILFCFTVVLLVTVSSFVIYSRSFGQALLYGSILSFAMIQLVWMANFWPFNYSTMAAANLMFYYVLWDMIQSSFTGTLSKKKTMQHIGYAVILLLFVLLSTRWVLLS